MAAAAGVEETRSCEEAAAAAARERWFSVAVTGMDEEAGIVMGREAEAALVVAGAKGRSCSGGYFARDTNISNSSSLEAYCTSS